jgi:hypothetical protein
VFKKVTAITLVAASIVLPSGSAEAQRYNFDRLPEPDPATARFDDACAQYATSKVAGFNHEKMDQWISDCSRHPDKLTCDATKKYVEDAIRSASELICGTKGEFPARNDRKELKPSGRSGSGYFNLELLPKPDPTTARFDDACAMIAATRSAGYGHEKMGEWLSDCSKHPNQSVCVATKTFLVDQGRKASDLICSQRP